MSTQTARWRRFVYTLWAPFYDALAGVFGPLRRRSIARLDLRKGQRVLIVGAGTGLDLDYLPRDVELTAVDLTPAMLDRLRERARCRGLGVDARVMDARRLEFAAGSFDAAILHLVLAVMPEPELCAREVARVLRPGGRAVILDKFLPDDGPMPLPVRMLAPVASFLGTQVDRRLGPVLRGSGLEVLSNEPAAAGGVVRIVVAEKAAGPHA